MRRSEYPCRRRIRTVTDGDGFANPLGQRTKGCSQVDRQRARRGARKPIRSPKWPKKSQRPIATRVDCGQERPAGGFRVVNKGRLRVGLREAAAGQLNSRSSPHRLQSVGLAEGSGIVGHGPSWDRARRNVDQGLVKPSLCAAQRVERPQIPPRNTLASQEFMAQVTPDSQKAKLPRKTDPWFSPQVLAGSAVNGDFPGDR